MNIPRLALLTTLPLFLLPTLSQAALPIPLGPLPHCTRSATLMHCNDGQGGFYGMAIQGNDLYLRGHDGLTGLGWAQTSTRFGRLLLLSGISGDGTVWFGFGRRMGWNVLNRLSTSAGDRIRLSCNRLKGCD